MVVRPPGITAEMRIAQVLQNQSLSRQALQEALGLRGAESFRQNWLLPALKSGVIVMTEPDKPTGRN